MVAPVDCDGRVASFGWVCVSVLDVIVAWPLDSADVDEDVLEARDEAGDEKDFMFSLRDILKFGRGRFLLFFS